MSGMERRNVMRRHLLLALLLSLSPVPACADTADSAIFGQARATIKLAQLSPDERRNLRERWEQASPEERIRMRQFFQDRLRQLPPPAQDAMTLPFQDIQRDNRRERNLNRGRESDRDDGRNAQPPLDSRFGFGFERRHPEEIQSEQPAWSGNRRRDEYRR
jgi:hypothetical protein